MNSSPGDLKPPAYEGPPPPVINMAPRHAPRPAKPSRSFGRVLIWVAFACVLFVRFVWMGNQPQRQAERNVFWQQREFRREPTFLPNPVAEVPEDLLRIHIEVEKRDAAKLRGYEWQGWRGQGEPQERPQVKVTVREGGVVYTNVALHLKGAAGSFRRFDDKPALTLNFNKHAKGQRFHGYSKISLNNSMQDPTFICEAISRELFEAAGVPAPKADHVTVLINGRDLGMYVMLEGYNKDFLRRHFKNVDGNLYDGGFCQEVHRNLNVNSGDHPEDRSDIDRLLGALRESQESNRWARLSEVLDMDRFITMLAMEVLTCHWDGYGLNRNNYRLYHDLDTDRMVFLPHGMDQMFAYPGNRFSTDSPIQPKMNGLIAQAVLTTPEGSRMYLERMGTLHTNLFKPDQIVGRVRELAAHIRPTIEAYGPSVAEMHDAAVDSLCERIQNRIQSVQAQLSVPNEPMEFEADGTAPLEHWMRTLNGQGRGPKMDKVEENGKTFLCMGASRGASGSWRAKALLPRGRYVFEGRARAVGDSGGGRLCLRISGARVPGEPVMTEDWVSLSFPFESREQLSEVVLVCEYRSARGMAWFDVDSLQLVRQPEE